jgi:tRNA acetyltransferase TAN1
MSVVGREYDELKRYNLSEIYSPTPRKQATGEAMGEATNESEAVKAEKSASAAG